MSFRAAVGRIVMQTIGPEAAWRTYLRSMAFVGPALLAWAFVAVYVFPKFQQMWVDSKMMDSEFEWIIRSVSFGMHNMELICALLALPILILEFTAWSPRYRRAVLAILVFVINTTIIVGLTGACVVAAIAGPALHR
ncbi:MAG TPA: hypothetical protein VI282_12095 [Verrucomicrobiae bacterium]